MYEVLLCGAIPVIAVNVLILYKNRTRIVGKNIALEDITEFFYTDSSSIYPPKYQRYHFYKNEKYQFYYEKREGNEWPLTDAHNTSSCFVDLSEKEWGKFLTYLRDEK